MGAIEVWRRPKMEVLSFLPQTVLGPKWPPGFTFSPASPGLLEESEVGATSRY